MLSFTSNSGRLITLRPPQNGDEQILYDFAREIEAEDTYILLNPREPVTMEEEMKYLSDILSRIRVNWQIHYLIFHETRLIGSSQVSLQGRRKKHLGSFGISLLKAYRHDGIGTKIASFILNEAKSKLHLSSVILECFASNLVACHLYQKLGFIEYGRLPHGLQYKDTFDDAILMYRNL